MEHSTSENAPWVKEQFSSVLSGSVVPESLRKLRLEAFEKFLELGIPTTGAEEWRYTNLTPVARTPFHRAVRTKSAGSLSELIASHTLPDKSVSGRAVFVNGYIVPELSFSPNIKGLVVSKLGEEAAERIIQENLETDRAFETESFLALNLALAEEILCIEVSENVAVLRPFEIVTLTVGEKTPISSFPRVLVSLKQGAEFSIVERQLAMGGDTFTNSVTEARVAANAKLSHTAIQELGLEAKQVSILKGDIARDAKLTSNVFHLGGGLVRNEIRPVFSGTNAECFLNGLSVIGGKQHIDNYTVIDHATPNCFSREMYKGVYADSSAGVFCGTIIVRKPAQKTNAIQSNQSLLLSPNATIETKPQLKIWADDVKCTHGATVGQLDENALFYLQSRGIPENQARQMLTEAFIGELIEGVVGEDLRNQIEALFKSRLRELKLKS